MVLTWEPAVRTAASGSEIAEQAGERENEQAGAPRSSQRRSGAAQGHTEPESCLTLGRSVRCYRHYMHLIIFFLSLLIIDLFVQFTLASYKFYINNYFCVFVYFLFVIIL